ncbi:FCER2 protein, partial [Polypterus senegalus]
MLNSECEKNNSDVQEIIDNLNSEWKRNYSELHESRDTLQSECDRNNTEMQETLDNAQSEWKANFSDLQKSQDMLKSECDRNYTEVQKTIDQCSLNCSELQKSQDMLKSECNTNNSNLQETLDNVNSEWKRKYNDLQESRDTLQSKYVTLNVTHYEVTKEFSVLKEFYCDGTNTSPGNTCSVCKPDWVPFSSKCYFISTDKLTWKESRDWCEASDGRLVNIESTDVLCGVDIMDQKARAYSVRTGTRRWPVAVFYNILDLAAMNAHVLYKACTGSTEKRRVFMAHLAEELRRRFLQEKAMEKEKMQHQQASFLRPQLPPGKKVQCQVLIQCNRNHTTERPAVIQLERRAEKDRDGNALLICHLCLLLTVYMEEKEEEEEEMDLEEHKHRG